VAFRSPPERIIQLPVLATFSIKQVKNFSAELDPELGRVTAGGSTAANNAAQPQITA